MKILLALFICLCFISTKADSLAYKNTFALGAGISYFNYKEDISKHYNYVFNTKNYRLKNRDLYIFPISYAHQINSSISFTLNFAYSLKGHTIELIDPPIFYLNPIKEDFTLYSINNLYGIRYSPIKSIKIRPYVELNSGIEYIYKATTKYYYNYFEPRILTDDYNFGRKIQWINNFQIGINYFYSKHFGIGAAYAASLYSTGINLPYKGKFQISNNIMFNVLFRL